MNGDDHQPESKSCDNQNATRAVYNSSSPPAVTSWWTRGSKTQTEGEKTLRQWPSCCGHSLHSSLLFFECPLPSQVVVTLPTISADSTFSVRISNATWHDTCISAPGIARTPLEPRAALVVSEDYHQSIPHTMKNETTTKRKRVPCAFESPWLRALFSLKPHQPQAGLVEQLTCSERSAPPLALAQTPR